MSGTPQLDLAALAGCTAAAISTIERRGATPRIDTVERLAVALGIPPCWLAFGADGHQPFRQRVPRLIEPDPAPRPAPGPHACAELFRGVPGRLEQTRTLRGLTHSALAAIVAPKPTREAIRLTELGRTVPSVATVERLAVALDVSPCWLAFGVGEPPRARD